MLCDVCKSNPAKFMMKTYKDGDVSETNICEKCALVSPGKSILEDNEALFTMISNVLPKTASQKAGDIEKICDSCGLTRKELMQKGKIGCSVCVDVFREELIGILQNVQGRHSFSGRIPKGLETGITESLEELQGKLYLAVEEERYEDAAVYRDRIREKTGGSVS